MSISACLDASRRRGAAATEYAKSRIKPPRSGSASFGQLISPLASYAGWSADRNEQVNHNSGWDWIAVKAICEEVAGQLPRVAYRRKPSELNTEKRMRCLTKMARMKALARLQSDEELEPADADHMLCQLLRNPNGPDTGWTFWYKTLMYLEKCGTAYWWLVPSIIGTPAEMWCVPSQWVFPRRTGKTDKLIDYYEIRPYGVHGAAGGGLHVDVSEMIEFAYPNPMTPLDGFAPTQAIASWIDVAESQDAAQWFAMRQGVWSGMVVELGPDFVDPDQATLDRVRSMVQQHTQGEHNAGRPMIVPPGAKVTKGTSAPYEMDFMGGGEASRDRILAGRRVSKSIAGVDDSSSFASMIASAANFVQRTIRPKLMMIDGIATEKLAKLWDDDLIVYHDDPTPMDPEFKLRENTAYLQAGVYSVNEIRTELGREPWDDPTFDKPTMPMGNAPAGGPQDDGGDGDAAGLDYGALLAGKNGQEEDQGERAGIDYGALLRQAGTSTPGVNRMGRGPAPSDAGKNGKAKLDALVNGKH